MWTFGLGRGLSRRRSRGCFAFLRVTLLVGEIGWLVGWIELELEMELEL